MPAMIILLTLPNAIVATMIGVSFLANGGYKSTNPNPTRKRGIVPRLRVGLGYSKQSLALMRIADTTMIKNSTLRGLETDEDFVSVR